MSGPGLTEKTKNMYQQIGSTKLHILCDGWLAWFKMWYVIRRLDASGKKLSAVHEASEQ